MGYQPRYVSQLSGSLLVVALFVGGVSYFTSREGKMAKSCGMCCHRIVDRERTVLIIPTTVELAEATPVH